MLFKKLEKPKKSPLTSLPFDSLLNPHYRLILCRLLSYALGVENHYMVFLPCGWCTCEWCGNDLLDEFCSLCDSKNSCVYDPNSNSFDCRPDSYQPPYPTYETYSCDSCENDSHFGYDCPPQFSLNYESELGYIESYNSYPYDSSSFPQKYLCCENCGEYCDEIKIDELKGNFIRMSIEINKKKKLQQLEQVDYAVVITPDFSITESLIMENEHLDTFSETESDEFIKSSVENLVPILNESEDFFDIKSECDMPDCDDCQTTKFSTISNPLFNDSTSSADESSHEEVIHEMSFKSYSNPLLDLDKEIISSEFNPIHNEDLDSTMKNDRFDTKSYLLESLLNRDTLMASSPKFDSLLKEFSGELTHTDLIPSGINEADCDPEEDIHLVERLLYDNSPPRPPKDFNSKNSDVKDNKEKDKMRAKPNKIKSKRKAWESPESIPTKSKPGQSQESIKKKQDKKIKGLDLLWIEDKKMKGDDANLEVLTEQAQHPFSFVYK
nr:hypothetical protein [Tanacetum cinerariifolium]